jgi:hypothetical protein
MVQPFSHLALTHFILHFHIEMINPRNQHEKEGKDGHCVLNEQTRKRSRLSKDCDASSPNLSSESSTGVETEKQSDSLELDSLNHTKIQNHQCGVKRRVYGRTTMINMDDIEERCQFEMKSCSSPSEHDSVRISSPKLDSVQRAELQITHAKELQSLMLDSSHDVQHFKQWLKRNDWQFTHNMIAIWKISDIQLSKSDRYSLDEELFLAKWRSLIQALPQSSLAVMLTYTASLPRLCEYKYFYEQEKMMRILALEVNDADVIMTAIRMAAEAQSPTVIQLLIGRLRHLSPSSVDAVLVELDSNLHFARQWMNSRDRKERQKVFIYLAINEQQRTTNPTGY